MADDFAKELESLPWNEIAPSAAALATITYVVPSIAALAHDATLGLPVEPAIVGTFRIATRNDWAHPAAAYTHRVAQHMPGPTWWWISVALGMTLIATLAWMAWVRLEPLTARARLGRRESDLRGSRPRTWAQSRDLRELTSRKHRVGRFTIGELTHRTISTGPEDHIAVIATTRAGKTTRCVIPWLLEHEGPAIVTSTKTDILRATEKWRTEFGRVHVWDPFGERSASWTPIQRCEDWTTALSQARWVGDATPQGDSHAAVFWQGEAAKLLAPMFHAAAIDRRTISDVLRWVDTQDEREPATILKHHHAEAAANQLTAVTALDSKNRGTTFMSAGSLLEAYRYPVVTRPGAEEFDVDRFLDGGPNTLYIVASARQQRLLAPLASGLISALLHGAMERTNRNATLRVLLDETANIAPLRDLPGYLSQAAGHNIRIATVWQSITQLEARYRREANTILANSTAKLFMGPITDDPTRRYLTDLVGEAQIPRTVTTTDDGGRLKAKSSSTESRPALAARDIQQLEQDRAVLITGTNLPAVVALKPWWDTRMRARGQQVR